MASYVQYWRVVLIDNDARDSERPCVASGNPNADIQLVQKKRTSPNAEAKRRKRA
jgi:hypothetical protein